MSGGKPEFSNCSTYWAITQFRDDILPRLMRNTMIELSLSTCFDRFLIVVLKGKGRGIFRLIDAACFARKSLSRYLEQRTGTHYIFLKWCQVTTIKYDCVTRFLSETIANRASWESLGMTAVVNLWIFRSGIANGTELFESRQFHRQAQYIDPQESKKSKFWRKLRHLHYYHGAAGIHLWRS